MCLAPSSCVYAPGVAESETPHSAQNPHNKCLALTLVLTLWRLRRFRNSNEGGVRRWVTGGGAHALNTALEIVADIGYVIAEFADLNPPTALRVRDLVAIHVPVK
jgi:hypothetical protein